MLEVVEGELCLLKVLVLEAMRCVPLCTLYAVGSGLRLLEVLQVEEGMRRVLLCMLEAVEGELSFGGACFFSLQSATSRVARLLII